MDTYPYSYYAVSTTITAQSYAEYCAAWKTAFADTNSGASRMMRYRNDSTPPIYYYMYYALKDPYSTESAAASIATRKPRAAKNKALDNIIALKAMRRV